MTIAQLNQLTITGNLGADAEIKSVTLKDGTEVEVANTTLYARRPSKLDGSFTLRLSIWPDSLAWRRLDRLKKGSMVVAIGSIEPRPYISSADNEPKAGLQMRCDRIEVIYSKGIDDAEVDEEDTESIAA